MNIKRAKQEIINTIRAYLQKDESGHYYIPEVRQRPVLLMGPPGIGKTQIMEQIAGECDLALVSYTITHHTRQSAIGLPFIKEKMYDGQPHSVTEYTMSEIIASMYDRMEASGKKEGILFIDEINCVSETLAPTMLQFLQGKTFGNQKVPSGWIIVAAGNPPEYNKSVREFDVVTLDRVKVINVEADYSVWKEYAYQAGIHGAIISYLDIRKENFYRMETTVDGKQFVTARGWEDLSEMIYAYERLGIKIDANVTVQYLQHLKTAKDFAAYLDLYYRYRTDYQIDEILSGTIRQGTLNKLKFAPFDEHLEVVGLILSRLSENFRNVWEKDQTVGRLFEQAKSLMAALSSPENAEVSARTLCLETADAQRMQMKIRLQAGQNERQVHSEYDPVIRTLEAWAQLVSGAGAAEDGQTPEIPEEKAAGSPAVAGNAAQIIRQAFLKERTALEEMTAQASAQLEYAFDFMEAAFGESQEMVVFITELTVNRYAMEFLNENECDRYYMYNKRLLFEDRGAAVRRALDEIRDLQDT